MSRPAVEAQDQVATEEAVSGVEARSVGRCVVVPPFSNTYRPIEGACFCGPVSGAYRGSVRTGRWGRSATGARDSSSIGHFFLESIAFLFLGFATLVLVGIVLLASSSS